MSAAVLIVLIAPVLAMLLTGSPRVRNLVGLASVVHLTLGVLGVFGPGLLGADGQGQLAGLVIIVYGWGVGTAVFTAGAVGIIFRRLLRGRDAEAAMEVSTLRSSRVIFSIAAVVDVLAVGAALYNAFFPVMQVVK